MILQIIIISDKATLGHDAKTKTEFSIIKSEGPNISSLLIKKTCSLVKKGLLPSDYQYQKATTKWRYIVGIISWNFIFTVQKMVSTH